MATKLSQSIEDQVTCPICLEQFQDPRILPCLHTYCKHCLEELLDKGTRKFSIQCPECRETFQIDRDVSSLKVNIWANRYLSLLEISKAEKENGETSLICNNCDNKEPAKARCFDCETFMCDSCITAHQLMSRLTKDHQLMTLEEIKNKGIPPMQKPTLCDKHKGKKQKLFCEECEVLICKDCTVIDHKDHAMSFIAEIVDKHKEKLTNKIEAMGDTKEEIESALETVKDMQEKVRQNTETIEQEIDERINTKIQTLEELRTRLKQESRDSMAIKMKRLSLQQHALEMHLAGLTSAVEFTKHILKKGSNSDVLSVVKQVLSRLSEKDIDDEVDDEAKQVLEESGRTTYELMINFLKVKDRAAPDPGMCKVSWCNRNTILLNVRNFKSEPINIKPSRIQINCPFQYTCSHNKFADFGEFIIKGPFVRPQEEDSLTGNIYQMEIWIDNRPIKGSPVEVQTDSSIWRKSHRKSGKDRDQNGSEKHRKGTKQWTKGK